MQSCPVTLGARRAPSRPAASSQARREGAGAEGAPAGLPVSGCPHLWPGANPCPPSLLPGLQPAGSWGARRSPLRVSPHLKPVTLTPLSPNLRTTEDLSFVASAPREAPTRPLGRAAPPPLRPHPHAPWAAAPPPRTRTSGALASSLPGLAALPDPSPREGPHTQSAVIAEVLYVGTGEGWGREAGEGRAAGGAGRAQARWAGVPSMSCRTEGPGGAAPGLQWIRSSCLRLWKGGVSEAGGGEKAWGGSVGCRCGFTGGPLQSQSEQRGRVLLPSAPSQSSVCTRGWATVGPQK